MGRKSGVSLIARPLLSRVRPRRNLVEQYCPCIPSEQECSYLAVTSLQHDQHPCISIFIHRPCGSVYTPCRLLTLPPTSPLAALLPINSSCFDAVAVLYRASLLGAYAFQLQQHATRMRIRWFVSVLSSIHAARDSESSLGRVCQDLAHLPQFLELRGDCQPSGQYQMSKRR